MNGTETPTELDLRDALDDLRELTDRRDSISYRLAGYSLDGVKPTEFECQVLLGREERLTKRVNEARQEVRRIKSAIAR